MEFKILDLLDFDPEKTIRFILKRKHNMGGFGPAPGVPPSIQDTYYALKILNMFSNIIKKKIKYLPSQDVSLYRYLNQMDIKRKNIPLKLIYYYLVSCKISGLKIKNFNKYILQKLNNNCITLEDRYYAKKILKEYYDKNIKYGIIDKWRTVKELWMIIYLKENILETKKDKVVSWINTCQNPDGGFGFLPNTTSFIENTYFCVKSLIFLDKHPKKIDRIIEFILNCYTGKGGFARKNGGIPLLSATYYAIQSLFNISTCKPFIISSP